MIASELAKVLRVDSVVGQLTPRDAQMYWLSKRLRSDQHLLYAFAGGDGEPDALSDFVARRCTRIADLRLRIQDVPNNVDYPYWAMREFGADQVLVHTLADRTWTAAEQAVAELLETPLDARVSPWRLHVFRNVAGAPNCGSDTALIAVLQLSHALADGLGASALARALFANVEPPDLPVRVLPTLQPALFALGLARLPWRFCAGLVAGVRSYRAEQELDRATEAGEVPAATVGQLPTVLNADPGPTRAVRMIVLPSARLRAPGRTVTVAVLAAISTALARYLEETTGARPERLGAEVSVAHPYEPNHRTRNNFGNVGVDLFPGESDPPARVAAIASALAARRERAVHPLLARKQQVTDALPALAVWHDVNSWPLNVEPTTVTGNTVVSSVFRGAADLEFGGGRVRFTAGFPALSPAMGLTHGVHGIGDTLTVSVTTSSKLMPDVDRYAALLRTELTAVARDQPVGKPK